MSINPILNKNVLVSIIEKDNLKIKSSEISANNMILDAKTINVEASKLKANSMEITTQILNMISGKESLYENEFSIKGGILTATIENKGKIEEVVIPSTIEVNDKLIFNKKDITEQLETDNLIKTLSSQGNLTVEQINLVKQIANSKEWHDKTTTLSGLGALIITVIVTYFTAGAGAGIAGSLSGAAAAGASATATQLAVQTAIQATIQAVTTQATTSLVTSAITGNKPQLDLNSVVTSAVTAGILSYVNGGFTMSNGVSQNKQTVLSSITGDKVNVNVNVGNNTHLKGSLLASGNFTEDGNFIDNKNLNFTTNTLTFGNLSNSSYSSNKSLGASANFNLSGVNDKNQDVQKGISSVGYNASNSLSINASKTLATLGQGNINIKDKENSDDLERLNTDTSKINKDLYSSSTGTKVDATLDTRLLTEKGREQIKQEYKDMDKNMKTIANTLPSATSDNQIESVSGIIWDNISAYITFGVLPSYGNNGGVLGEIPILSGNKDSVKEQLQIVSQKAPLYQQDSDKFIPIEQSEAYKQMSDEKKAQVEGLYISKEPMIVTKDNATYQNGGNGIMNDKGLAVFNVLEQTGMIGQYQTDKTKPVEATVFYNPSRGMIADSMETMVDLFGGTTGIAKQYGEFNVDVTTARGTNGSNFTQHSQDNILLKSGVNFINSSDNIGAKFMPQEYFISKTELGVDGNPKNGTPSFVSFGSPVNGQTLNTLISNPQTGLGYTYKGAFTKSGDFVGEGLGGNSGANGEASFIDRANLLNIIKLITSSSPHSSYKPSDYPELQDVTGYKK